MQKIWQWLRERKANTVRKWRSTQWNGDSEEISSPDRRRAAATSDPQLSRSKGVIQRIQRKLTPNRLPNGTQQLRVAPADGDFRQLLMEEESCGSVNSVAFGRMDENDRFLQKRSESNASMRSLGGAAALPPTGANRWSMSGGLRSAPTSTRAQRRRLRFVIPQVSLSSDDPNASTTLLFASNDSLEMSGDALDAPSPSGLRGTYSPTPNRRTTEFDTRRRSSLAQRRQSTASPATGSGASPLPNRHVQLVQSVSGRRTSTTLIPLSQAQIHLIRTLWRQVYASKGPTVIGETVIHRLFFKYPKIKEQFRRCPLPRNFPNFDSFAKFHSKAMGELVDSIVENLDNLDSMGEHLERIGRAHAQVMSGQLSSKLWNNVAETFIDCTLEWGDRRCRSETVRKAWALIIAYMVEKIKHGHLDQRKQMLAMKSTIASLERVAFTS